ncbi:hypothetical protein C5167_039724 [Papaver somniferum]|uniref:Secreted protein n=1 Tax=Papaver somniferum TaxID=3469 RepID=A0A4Y7IGE0_PAPSO|nr:hypothetical protein C5167_039724 [Papaver somniferum]
MDPYDLFSSLFLLLRLRIRAVFCKQDPCKDPPLSSGNIATKWNTGICELMVSMLSTLVRCNTWYTFVSNTQYFLLTSIEESLFHNIIQFCMSIE